VPNDEHAPRKDDTFSALTLYGGLGSANETLKGLLKTIDYPAEYYAVIESLSQADLEWFLYKADIKEAFRFSGPRILGLIGEAIQRNRSRFEGETVDRYVRRAIEIAEASKKTEFYPSSLIVLGKKFDHPLVTEFLRSNSPTEVQPLSSPESANKLPSPLPSPDLRQEKPVKGR
jgi:hypothetical protein